MHGITEAYFIKHSYLGHIGSLWNLHTEPLKGPIIEPNVQIP